MDTREVRGEREPDYRMSLAAERTYLAYLRTGLAVLAAGVAVIGAPPDAGAQGDPHSGEPLRTSRVVQYLGLVLDVAAVAAAVIVLVL